MTNEEMDLTLSHLPSQHLKKLIERTRYSHSYIFRVLNERRKHQKIWAAAVDLAHENKSEWDTIHEKIEMLSKTKTKI